HIEHVNELEQYLSLRVEVANVAMESLQKVREGSKKAIMQLVDIEYNTVDFFLKLLQL
ncbi:hypothetical protein Bca52824_040242, partial [Brassica carinata]